MTPSLLPDVGAPSDALAHAAPAHRRPFLLAATRARVVGDELRGDLRLEADGRALLEGLGVPGATAATVILAPRHARRELFVGPRPVTETILLPARLPGAIVQWIAGPGGPGPTTIRYKPAAGWERADAEPDLEKGMWCGEHRDGTALLLRFHPSGPSLGASRDGLEAHADLEPGTPLTLLAAAGPDRDAALATLDALARVRVHAVRAGATVETDRSRRPALHTGVPELDDALAWAKARLSAAAPPPRDAIPGAPWLGHALVARGQAALGFDDEAAAMLGAIEPDDNALPARVIGRAWVVSWAGTPPAGAPDLTDIAPVAEKLFGRLDRADQASRPLVQIALDACADLLDGASRREEAEDVRRRLREPPSRGRALPMAGSPRATSPIRPLDRVLEAAAESGPSAAAFRAWRLFREDRFDEGYLAMRGHLARGLDGPVGCWGDPDGPLDDPIATALVPILLLHGLLGARPDAPFGRLRLAPALPRSWASFRMTGIRLGDTSLDLACRVDAGRHTFVLRPTGGAVPCTVVFEPTVAGPVDPVAVNGAPAEVTVAPAGARTRASLQFPLDHERSVSLGGPHR